eukprot:gb/GECG01016698.1/.p1 GENE.gb/GECG01016698.1/~~gb/GECG01016698.1/.p1  ORF type:complete len:510 (+),score=68.35 gb/GECG01016698.1/:1-1530(+)
MKTSQAAPATSGERWWLRTALCVGTSALVSAGLHYYLQRDSSSSSAKKKPSATSRQRGGDPRIGHSSSVKKPPRDIRFMDDDEASAEESDDAFGANATDSEEAIRKFLVDEVFHGSKEKESEDRIKAKVDVFNSLIDTKVATATSDYLNKHAGSQGKNFPPVRRLNNPKRILVTGGAGFVGSNLVDVLMQQGHQVYVLDNLFTGRRRNIEHWIGHPHFEFFQTDVTQPFYIEVDQIYHLACPASPPHYQHNPIKTIKCSTHGTLNMLGLAKRVNARLLFTSTSEIYGDPLEYPQKETYWGNVNCWGIRSCYDEGKRVAESMCFAYRHQNNVHVRIARIFNTFGPRMEPNDGRVVSNFIKYALMGDATKPIEIYGTGEQTRSFQYVGDLVQGLIALMHSDHSDPVNLGNPSEYTIKDWAVVIRDKLNPSMPIVHVDALGDDPKVRKPDIRKARDLLGWEPKVDPIDGLEPTILYFKHILGLATEKDEEQPALWLNELPDALPPLDESASP